MDASSQTTDIPFTVHGYVTDPKLVGYQVLTNYESTYWRALVGKDAWALYEVLRSFCHQGEKTCHPSINLLMAILGLKQRWVLTGGMTKVKGKEYRYPGLIEVLQEHKLIVAEVVGEGPTMRYVFHVNLTPGLLTDDQIHQLPGVLQRKHVELIERCQQRQSELEAKRRPPKVTIPKTSSSAKQSEEGSHNLLEGGLTNCERGSHNLLPEQHPINITHRTPSSARDNHNNNSGGSAGPPNVVVANPPSSSIQETVEEEPHRHPENAEAIQPAAAVANPPIPLDPPSPTPNQAAEQALLAIGIGKTVAQRLVARYRAERILEKIEFLAFLQAERPDTIENPRGWLRRAIEEDYGAPDGYRSAAERAQQAAEEAAQEEREQHAAQQQQAFADRLAAQEAAFRQQLTEQYGTTAADEKLWQEVLLDFKHGQPDLYNLFSSTQILSVNDERVQLGFTHEMAMRRLQHPGTLAALKRALKAIAKRPLEVETVLLSQDDR